MDQKVAEFIELNYTVSIAIKLPKQGAQESSVDTNLKFNQHGLKFICGQDSVSVDIEFSEYASQHEFFSSMVSKVEEFMTHGFSQVFDLLFCNGFALVFTHAPN